jgi:hypothetical protein
VRRRTDGRMSAAQASLVVLLCLQSSLDSTASMNVRNINLDKNKRQEIRNRNQSAIVLLQLLDTASRRHLDYLNDCHLPACTPAS